MHSFIKRSLALAVTLLIVAILSVIVITFLQSRKIKDSNIEITRNEENRYFMQQLLLSVLDNETGARGYVITGKHEFLDPLNKSEKQIKELLFKLRERTINPVLSHLLKDSLTPLLDKRIEFSRTMVLLQEKNLTEEVRNLVIGGQGKLYTDEIRSVSEKMEQIRNQILNDYRTSNQQAIRNLNLFLYFTIAVIFILSVLNFREIILFDDKQKQIEAQLRESEEIFSTLFYKSPIMKMIFEPATVKILDVNESFCHFVGFSKENLIGKTTIETGIKLPSPLREQVIEKIQKNGFVRNEETKFQTQNGNNKWVSLNLDKINIRGNNWLIGSYVDITDRKNNEQLIANMNRELEQRVIEKTKELVKNEEKLRSLNETLERKVLERTAQLEKASKEMEAFSYSVSHDLRAPLRSIIGFTNILEEDYGQKMSEEEKRLFSIIKSSSQKMGALIDDLLTFARLERKEISNIQIDMHALVQDVISEYSKLQNIDSVKWDIKPLPPVNADPGTIKQVWVNLIGNALKYSRNKNNPLIEIGSTRKDEQTVFFIKDNGVGFDAKYKEKLFKVFQRLHSEHEFEGTGIGLALVEKIISKHGGAVWAEGEVEQGACFYFSIP